MVRILLHPAVMATTPATTPVADVMGAPIPAVQPDTRLSEAASTMRRHRIRELPVVDGDSRLLGILSETDLQPYRGHLEWTVARAAMSSPPISIESQEQVAAAVRLLLAFGVNALPVVHGGRLVGMMRRHDLLGLLLAEGV